MQLSALVAVFSKGRVLIVDNSPDHKTVKKVKCDSILNKSNLGFAVGVNQGIDYCLKKKADWILVLNQDVSIEQKELNEFIANLRSKKPALVGPVVGILDNNRWTTILSNVGSEKFNYVTASFLAIHKEIISKIGYFYEPYFMYYEDVDYCVRARKSNIELEHFDLRSYSHDESSAIGKNSALHNYYLARNHMLFIERLGPLRVKMYEFMRLPKTIIEFFINGNKGGLLGLLDYFLRRFGKCSYAL